MPNVSFSVAPGSVICKQVTRVVQAKSEGGIILPDIENPGKLRYGNVMQSGIYVDHLGNPRQKEVPEFPLKPGTLIEHKNHNPFEDAEQTLIVKTEDVTRMWAPGCWPEWAKEKK